MTNAALPRKSSSRSGAASVQADRDAGWARFRTSLRRAGRRVTQARRSVCDHVMGRRDHFSADEVAQCLARGQARVSRATVYHTLALMVDAGLVREVGDTAHHRHYETLDGRASHDHMVCNRCGRVVEFHAPALDEALAAACRREGFHPDSHRAWVFGQCAECGMEKRPKA